MKLILETQRLRLREIEETDLDDLVQLDSDREVMKYIGDGTPSTREQIAKGLVRVRQYYQNHPGLGLWLVEGKSDNSFLGWACLKHLAESAYIEVGYRLMRHAWGQGIATEAARGLIEYGWNALNLEVIVGITHPLNRASQRVLEKCGMQRIGDRQYYGHDVTFYEIHRPG